MFGRDKEKQTEPFKTRVFISYSRKDKEFVEQIVPALEAENIEVFIDNSDHRPKDEQDAKSIATFEDWWKRLEEMIIKSDTVIFVISPASMTSEVCQDEVNFAKSHNKRFAPIVWQDPGTIAVPQVLSEINYLFFNEGTDFEVQIKELITALKTNVEWIRKHTDYTEKALAWKNIIGRNAHKLLQGKDIELAEQWRDSHPQDATPPSELQLDYISSSRKAQIKKQRQAIFGLFGIILVSCFGVFFWYTEKQKANEEERRAALEEANRLGEVSSREIDRGERVTGLLVALEAWSILKEKGIEKNGAQVGVKLYGAFHAGPGSWKMSGMKEGISSFALSSDGSRLLTGGIDGVVRVWHPKTGQQMKIWPGHFDSINLIKFSPDGKKVISGGKDGIAILRHYPSGEVISRVTGHASPIKQIIFDKFEPRFATIGQGTKQNDAGFVLTDGSKDALIWNADNGEFLFSIQPSTKQIKHAVANVDFLATGDIRVLYGSGLSSISRGIYDAKVSIWDGNTGRLKENLHSQPIQTNKYGKNVSLTFDQRTFHSPDGSVYIHVVKLNPRQLKYHPPRIINSNTGKVITQLDDLEGKKLDIRILFSSNSKVFAIGINHQNEKTLQIRDLADGAVVCSLNGWVGFSSWSFDPNGNFLIAYSAKHGALGIWDAKTCKLMHPIKLHSQLLNSTKLDKLGYAAQHDGKIIVAGLFGVELFNFETGEKLGSIKLEQRKRILYGNFLKKEGITLYDNGHHLQKWNLVPHGVELKTVNKFSKISDLKFEAALNGQRLMIYDDKSFVLWDVNNSKQLIKLKYGNLNIDSRFQFIYQCWPTSQHICLVFEKGETIVLRLKDGIIVKKIISKENISKPNQYFTYDGKIYIDYAEQNTNLINLESKRVISKFPKGAGYINFISTNESRLFLNSVDGKNNNQMIVVSLPDGKKLGQLKKFNDFSAFNSVVNFNGNRFVTKSKGGKSLGLWNVKTFEFIRKLTFGNLSLNDFSMHPNSKFIIATDDNDSVRVWKISNGQLVAKLEPKAKNKKQFKAYLDTTLAPKTVAFSLEDLFAYTSGRQEREPKIWNFFPSLRDLAKHIRKIVPSCLTAIQRTEFGLKSQPPRWCITGSGLEREKDPNKWQPKYPYHTKAWKDWLIAKDEGKTIAMPTQ